MSYIHNSKLDILTGLTPLAGNILATDNILQAFGKVVTLQNGVFLTQGNSFGTDAILGTNDNFNLQFETNGSTKATLLTNGNFGIGTLTPTVALEVNGSALFQNDVVIQGSLTVNGDPTIIQSTTVQVADKNIELGVTTTPTDITANNGGITLKGTTDKTITWLDSDDTWHFNQGISLDNQLPIKFFENTINGTNSISLQSKPLLTQDYIFTLPDSYGVAGSVLTTDGLGSMIWTAIASILSAENGLNVVGTTVRLGGNLIINTNINGLDLYDLTFTNIPTFRVENTDGFIENTSISTVLSRNFGFIDLNTTSTSRFRILETGQIGINTINPLSGLQINTTLAYKYDTINNVDTTLDNHLVVIVKTDLNPVTISLPDALATSNEGRIYYIKREGANDVTITTTQTIDNGLSTFLLTENNQSIQVLARDGYWHIISEYKPLNIKSDNNIQTISSNYTITNNDFILSVISNCDITLPAVPVIGETYKISVRGSASSVNIVTQGTHLIDGNISINLGTYNFITLRYIGINDWSIGD